MKANTKVKVHNKYEVKILLSPTLQSSCKLIQTILWLSFNLSTIHNNHNFGTILALPKAQHLHPFPMIFPMHLNHSVKLGLYYDFFFCCMRQKRLFINHTTMTPEIKVTLSKNLFEKIQLLAIFMSAFNRTGM